jgi:hypothetical protein
VQNVEVSFVRKSLRRFVRLHTQNLTAEIAEVAEKKGIQSGNQETTKDQRFDRLETPGFLVSGFLAPAFLIHSSPSK